MNSVILIGRLTAEPDIRYTQGTEPMCVARYSLAVDRPTNKNGEREADFIRCIAFGKCGEFAERYLHKGMKIAIEGRIQTGSYTNNNGQRVYTTDIVVNSHEFCESLRQQSAPQSEPQNYQNSVGDGFVNIPEGVEDSGLPWN